MWGYRYEPKVKLRAGRDLELKVTSKPLFESSIPDHAPGDGEPLPSLRDCEKPRTWAAHEAQSGPRDFRDLDISNDRRSDERRMVHELASKYEALRPHKREGWAGEYVDSVIHVPHAGLGGPTPLPPKDDRDLIEKYGTRFFVGMMVFSVVFLIYYAPDRVQTWVGLAQDLHQSYFPVPPKDPLYFPSTKEQEIVLPSAETMGLYDTSPPPPSTPGEEGLKPDEEPEPLNPTLDKGFSRGQLLKCFEVDSPPHPP
eukprot:5448069-Pyramimonas_sp.AAC.4